MYSLLLYSLISFSTTNAAPHGGRLNNNFYRFFEASHSGPFYNVSEWPARAGFLTRLSNSSAQKRTGNHNDSLPKTNDVTVVIPFEYKQSSLNYTSTFNLMDSVAAILQMDDSIKVTINGYSYFDEGSEEICHYLSLNRALSVKYYVVGRGVDSLRLIETNALGRQRSIQRKKLKEPVEYNCTVEITIHYPIPIPPDPLNDMDEDGITDKEDSCKSEYGYKAFNGCPDKDAIIVPFELQQSSLFSTTYKVLDSVVMILRKDPTLTITIQGHAYKKEGVKRVCDQLAKERADIAKRYLLTRQVDISRIDAVKGLGTSRPITAGRNPWEIARNARVEIFLVRH